MTVREILASASERISARHAELLLAHKLDRDRAWLLSHSQDEVNATAATAFVAAVQRRASGEPLQYITGHQEFFGLNLRVTPAVLIPRPETEHLVEAVLDWAQVKQAPLLVADVGTGSGAIALALAKNLPNAKVTAIDISEVALEVARENAQRLGLIGQLTLMQGDLLSGVSTHFDAVVSNPPYVPSGDASTMHMEVVAHEPHLALFAGSDGLEVYRKLIPQAAAHLRPRGLLAMEIGFGQRDALTTLLEGWNNVRFIQDYADIPRVVTAERS